MSSPVEIYVLLAFKRHISAERFVQLNEEQNFIYVSGLQVENITTGLLTSEIHCKARCLRSS